jgi:hypothetical protein
VNTLNCLHCGKIAQTSAVHLKIEATRGLRLDIRDGFPNRSSYSRYDTVTPDFVLCDECLHLPELEAITVLISSPYSERSYHAGNRCVVLCRNTKPRWFFPGLRRRVQLWPSRELHRCPLCGLPAAAWPAWKAPTKYNEEAEKIVHGDQAGRVYTRRKISPAAAVVDRWEAQDHAGT